MFGFPTTPTETILLEIPAGPCEYKDNIVTAKERYGRVLLKRSPEGYNVLMWVENETNNILMNYFVFGDVSAKVIERDDGLVFRLKIEGSDALDFFWVQDPEVTKEVLEEKLSKVFNLE